MAHGLNILRLSDVLVRWGRLHEAIWEASHHSSHLGAMATTFTHSSVRLTKVTF